MRLTPIILFAVALQISALAWGEDQRHTPGSGHPLNEVLGKITTVRGLPIEEDPPGEMSFSYVNPNEMFGHLFEPCLPSGGALVTVGTFRGLNNASSGKVEQLVLLDYNRGIKLFNLANLQLILLSKDRFDYLSLLTGKRENPFLTDARAGKISVAEYVHKLSDDRLEKLRGQNLSNQGMELATEWKSLGVTLPGKDDWDDLAHKNQPQSKNPLELVLAKKFPKAIDNYVTAGTLNETIFGNDQRFATIKKMIAEGKVTVVQGDLTGSKTLNSVAAALTQKGIKVSGADVSNVPGDFAREMDKPENRELMLGLFDKMIGNLRALPYDPKGRVMFTTANATSSEDLWKYYSLRPNDLAILEMLFKRPLPDGKLDHQLEWDSELPKLFFPDPTDKTGRSLLCSPISAQCDS